jgi:hypothetical protein
LHEIQSDYDVSKPSTPRSRDNKESYNLQHGRIVLQHLATKAVETEEEEGLAAEGEVEAVDEVVAEVAEAAAMSQGLPMTRAHRSRGNVKRLTRARVRTITARLSETRRWPGVDSPHKVKTP